MALVISNENKIKQPLEVKVGNTIGWLEIIAYKGKDKYYHEMWLCRCKCSLEKTFQGNHLRTGKIMSCGCYNSAITDLVGKKLFSNSLKITCNQLQKGVL